MFCTACTKLYKRKQKPVQIKMMYIASHNYMYIRKIKVDKNIYKITFVQFGRNFDVENIFFKLKMPFLPI